jgi:type VI secretion system protein ImpI
MGLTLTIENETSLPDGGPLSVAVTGKRGIDIGRDQHLDWTLPDPTRYISAKHCEVRYRDGGYWLYDVSTNGTFLNGSDGRLKAPHRLNNGDRLTIGQYIIAVALDGEDNAARPATPTPAPVSYQELWSGADDAAPPIDSKLLRPPAQHKPVNPDFLHWAVDVPDTLHADPDRAPARPAPADDDLWARGPARPAPPVEPQPAMPAPRRPVWVSTEPSGAWAAPPPSNAAVEYPATREAQPPTPSWPNAQPDFAPPAPASEALAPQALAPQALAPQALAPQVAATGGSAAPADFMRHLAHGAKVPDGTFARDPAQLAEELGVLIRMVTENMRQLLSARLQAKRIARMSNQTSIEALNNNPLKFSPTSEDALRIMFGAPTASYLDARRALEEAFGDLKEHQIRTYSAMQQAIAMMVADLDPQAIDNATEADRGLSGVIGSRKARLWDAYVARWQAKTRGQDGGLADVFMQYFAECYDSGDTRKR